eukprot:ANDGO_05966.mRNA.1 hypothetical protein
MLATLSAEYRIFKENDQLEEALDVRKKMNNAQSSVLSESVIVNLRQKATGDTKQPTEAAILELLERGVDNIAKEKMVVFAQPLLLFLQELGGMADPKSMHRVLRIPKVLDLIRYFDSMNTKFPSKPSFVASLHSDIAFWVAKIAGNGTIR